MGMFVNNETFNKEETKADKQGYTPAPIGKNYIGKITAKKYKWVEKQLVDMTNDFTEKEDDTFFVKIYFNIQNKGMENLTHSQDYKLWSNLQDKNGKTSFRHFQKRAFEALCGIVGVNPKKEDLADLNGKIIGFDIEPGFSGKYLEINHLSDYSKIKDMEQPSEDEEQAKKEAIMDEDIPF